MRNASIPVTSAFVLLLAASLPASADVLDPHTDRCRDGYVWRSAAPGDKVCVTPASRDRARQDNAAAASRRRPGAEHGPNACAQGYVWREAFPGDVVCVVPATRDATRDENAQAASRRAPKPRPVPAPAPRPADPDACAQGYVWRSAAPGDKVCVSPVSRDRVKYENSQADANRQPNAQHGPNACKQGYVWRSAFQGDMVCVTPDARDRVKRENADGPAKRQRR